MEVKQLRNTVFEISNSSNSPFCSNKYHAKVTNGWLSVSSERKKISNSFHDSTLDKQFGVSVRTIAIISSTSVFDANWIASELACVRESISSLDFRSSLFSS